MSLSPIRKKSGSEPFEVYMRDIFSEAVDRLFLFQCGTFSFLPLLIIYVPFCDNPYFLLV